MEPGNKDSCTASTSSSSWLSNLLADHRKKQSSLFSLDELAIVGGRRIYRSKDRGMSLARYSDDGEEEECIGGSNGYSSESSQGWKQMPTSTRMHRGLERLSLLAGSNASFVGETQFGVSAEWITSYGTGHVLQKQTFKKTWTFPKEMPQ
ncbi:hypothetical protein RJ640_004991 [Escallonia rubra]|uniref:Uncharacterized protein n=1 Tax=Escallonia rubra TaxID=112253 RepID=A0AA88U7V8_9ASTE|nr:hypothetical protein RJ640_004991 [Escallonia rubra]